MQAHHPATAPVRFLALRENLGPAARCNLFLTRVFRPDVNASHTEGGPARPRLVVATTPAPTDEALCLAFVEGDEAAFTILVERYRTLVFSLVRRFAPQPDDAA